MKYEALKNTFILKCDRMIVVKLDGWEESEGVNAEIEFALDQGIPIEYIEI